jgi:hypothetical protein
VNANCLCFGVLQAWKYLSHWLKPRERIDDIVELGTLELVSGGDEVVGVVFLFVITRTMTVTSHVLDTCNRVPIMNESGELNQNSQILFEFKVQD